MIQRIAITLCLALGLSLASCQWLSKQAENVGEPVSGSIDKVGETVPSLVGISQQLQAFYELNRAQIDALLPNAPELFARLAEGTQKASDLAGELAAVQAQAKAASRKPDGSTDWGAYLVALASGLMAWQARRKGVAEVQVVHDRVTSRKDENAELNARLVEVEALLEAALKAQQPKPQA